MSPHSARAVFACLAFAVVSCVDARSGAVDSTARQAATRSQGSAGTQPSVPVWLQPIFAALDTLLTDAQRDTLRSLHLDSAFTYRAHKLGEIARPMEPEWIRLPYGDTLIARGERQPGHVAIPVALDLYQQHLQRKPLDVGAAIHRMSPDYVSNYGATFSVDSVLLEGDLDGSGVADRLVRETRTPARELESVVVDRRLALYLDATTNAGRKPAWSTGWDETNQERVSRRVPLHSGSLLVIEIAGPDADETVLLRVRPGDAREILRHQIDYGDGAFSIRAAEASIVATLTKRVSVDGREITPRIQCPANHWPGSTLTFAASDARLVNDQATCVPWPQLRDSNR